MKNSRNALVAFVAAALLVGCGKKSETSSPITRAAMPADHSLDFETGFVASDLTHGVGAAQLTVNRRWCGSDTLNTHFGQGWSDQNVMQLTLVSHNVVLIWRGGVGWLTAHRNGEKLFEGDDGEKIERTDKGWTAQLLHGITLTFDTSGRLISKKPAAGPACNYNYDKSGRLISMGTAENNELKYNYDRRGRTTRVDGPEGLRLEYHYDDKGRLADLENSRKVRIEYRYTGDGKLLSAKDQLGNELELARIGPVKRPVVPAAKKLNVLGQLPKPTFDAQGRITATKEGAASKSYEYDEAGRTSAIEGPEGRATCKYDAFGRIASVQNPNGTSMRFEYNNLDLPTLISKPDGQTEKLKYDEHGRLLRRERSPTDWEELSYDSAGRMELRRTPPAAEEHYGFGDADRVTHIKYSSGREVGFEYDPTGRILSESWSSGEKRMWRYDADGRVAESVSSTGLKTTYRYDAKGQLVAAEDSVHGRTSHRRLPSGDVVETAGGKTTTMLTEWGNPLEIVEPGGARMAFNYDNRGLLERVLSPMNMPWRYEYNSARKLTAIVAPSGLRTSTTWDAAGRRTKLSRGNVAWRDYHYNSAGRVEQEYSGTGRAARYGYGRDGQVGEVELPDGKVSYTTDKDGLRFTRKGSGYQIEDRYNGDGTLSDRKYKPAGFEVKLPLDSAGRAAGIELNDLKAVYGYDTRGQLAQITLPGGTTIKVATDEAGRPIEFTFGNSLVEKISYDRSDRITSIEAKQSSGKNVFSERYAHDAAGNLSQRITDSGLPEKFEYDRESRLIRGSSRNLQRTFTYDADGNLTTNGDGERCQIDNLGRPIQQGATSYSWDAGGNLTLVQSATGKIDNAFDTAGRLVERRDGKNTWKFGYDSGHDRLWKEGPSGKRWYAYLDDGLAGFKDEAGTVWLIVSFPGTDRPLAVCGSNGTTLFIVHDRLGSARRFVDVSGAIVASDDYTPFGSILASSGQKPIGLYAGIVQDETGLFYARRRYYDPNIARFISIDPLIGTPGIPSSHNPYAYAANNPFRYRDPMGTGSFEDEIANQHSLYDYVYKKDPRDPTGNTLLKDAKGDPIPETHESGPFKGEPIVDKSKPATPVQNYNFHNGLSDAEKAATRQAYDGANAARQAIQNPASTAQEVKAASEALAAHEAELARLNEVMKLRSGHATLLGGERAGWGGINSQQLMAEQEKRLAELGADPFEHYSESTQDELRGERAAGLGPVEAAAAKEKAAAEQQAAAERAAAEAKVAAEAEAAARDAKQEGAFKRGSKTGQVAPGADANKTGQVKPEPAGGVAEGGAPTQAEEAAKAASAKVQGAPGADEMTLGKTAGTSTTKTVPGGEHPPGWEAETFGKKGEFSGKTVPGEGGVGSEVIYDAKTGGWKPKIPGGGTSSFAAGEAGERWLGPKILEAGGKLLKPLGPLLKAVEIFQAAELGGTMANNFINNLNAPFAKEQADKAAARELAKELADKLRQLGAADPNAIIMPDGRKFDPANPKDIDDLMSGFSQNIYFGRKPFDGLLKYVPKIPVSQDPTTFMGAAEGDTAAAFTLDNALKLLQTAIALEKAAGEAAKDCIREQTEAQSQLQNVMTLAGGRAVAESDLATLPETANDVKSQTAKVKAQTKAVQAAFEEMTAAVGVCDGAATKICNFAAQSASATEEQVTQWRAEATSDLFAASNTLNSAQAKIDKVDVAVDELRTSIATLDGFRTALSIYKMGSGAAEGAGIKPDAAFTAAKAAAERASAARGRLGPLLEQLSNIGSQITSMLAPYVSVDFDAAAVAIAAKSIGTGIELPSLVDLGALITFATPMVEAALSNQKNVEKAIGNIDIDGIISAAREALTEADNLSGGASALATSPERYRSLQTANQCLAAIVAGKAETTAEATPTPTATPTELAAASPNASPVEDEFVVVPSVQGAESVEYTATILRQAGFKPVFNAVKPKEKKDELKFAGQDVEGRIKKSDMEKRGNVVVVLINQKFQDAQSAEASPTPEETKEGTMPTLIGLTLDQATTRLTDKMSIGGDEVGDKPPTPEKAYTIYAQNPAAGSKIASDQKVVVTVKRYGSAKEAPPEETPASGGEQASSGSGDWVGTWAETGPNGLKISRAASGYILIGGLTDGKPVPGKEQGGSLVFSWDLDLRDVVGVIGQTTKIGKKEDSTLGAKYIFTHNGDKLDMVMETTQPGGKVQRNSFNALPRVGN